jgi:alanine dehydrogenase
MRSEGTLLLRRSESEDLLTLRDCIDAVEEIFCRQGNGNIPASGILGVKSPEGGLHVKAGLLSSDKNYIVAKLNTNFPGNSAKSNLPTIQGVVVVYDAEDGRPLAIVDSIDITIKRTAAASAVAAKYLARPESRTVTICGCGQQARAQLHAIHLILPFGKVYAFDLNERAAKNLAAEIWADLKVDTEPVTNLQRAIQNSDVCVTCTTSREYFVRKEEVAPGTFIAAVGADDAHKQEIDPRLMATAKVVADSLEQCCTIGDTHHAIAHGLITRDDIYGELCEIVAGKKAGRTSGDEIIVFDSTGIAIEDAAAAAAIYEKADVPGIGSYFNFAA